MKLISDGKIIITKPKRRSDIERLAAEMRRKLKISDDTYLVDVLRILEFDLRYLFGDGIDYDIPDKWTYEVEAYYDAVKNMIFIRADVYDRAVLGDGRARYTIMHEIAHYILFKTFGKPVSSDISCVVLYSDATFHSMCPEWQAETFAGAFLCKKELVRFMDAKEIERKCCVTSSAAETAFNLARGITYTGKQTYAQDYSHLLGM